MAIEKWGAQLRLATEFVIQANWAAPQLQMNREWVVSYERTPKVCYFWSSAGPPSFLMGKPMGNLWFWGRPYFEEYQFLGVVSTLTPNWLGEVRFGFKSRLVSSSPFEIFLAKVDSWPVGRLLGSEWVRRNNANGVWSLPCHHLQPFSRSFLYRGMNLEISLLLRVLPGIICCQLSLCTSFAHL